MTLTTQGLPSSLLFRDEANTSNRPMPLSSSKSGQSAKSVDQSSGLHITEADAQQESKNEKRSTDLKD